MVPPHFGFTLFTLCKIFKLFELCKLFKLSELFKLLKFFKSAGNYIIQKT